MESNTPLKANKHGPLLGILSFLAEGIAVMNVTVIGFASFTSFNPPGWLRVVTMAPFPFAVVLSVAFGLAGWLHGNGKAWAGAGISLASAAVIAFIIMIIAGG